MLSGLPDAELLLIAVRLESRGSGLAGRLVDAMEAKFCKMGFVGDYNIFTEAKNNPANKFYVRLGAELTASYNNRKRIINRYRKKVEAQNTTP